MKDSVLHRNPNTTVAPSLRSSGAGAKSSANHVAAPTGSAVRSIDVGFGLVKLSLPATDGGDSVRFSHFPSMAIPSDPTANAMLGVRRRNTFDIPVGGAFYEAGAEVGIAQTGEEYGRAITDEFYRSPIYEALTKCALRYMYEAGDRKIDLLVLGLPVNQYLEADRRQFLERTYRGTHDLGDGTSIEVASVVVQAQPMGGYMELDNHIGALNEKIASMSASVGQIEELDDITVLMVDPGEHTLDWLLLQKGSLTTKASGAASDAGRHRVVRAVHEALKSKLGRPLGAAAMVRINEALRSGEPLRLSGVAHDLSEFEPVIRQAVIDPINRLIDGMRSMHEFVDVIALVGGHPERYRDVLEDRFPSIPVFIIEPSVEANVRGFQAIGEAILEQRAARAKAAAN